MIPYLFASFSKADACYADGGLKKDDLQVLEKSSSFLFVLHSPNSIAAPLFAPCSTQRLYLHEHPDFDGIDDVISLYSTRPSSLVQFSTQQ